MAEYYALLTRAVGRLQPSTEASRRDIYVKARNALIQQLKAITPPLSASEISKQRLELEEAIRKVEREMAGGGPPASEADISRSAARAMEEALAGAPEPPPPPRPVAAAAPRPQLAPEPPMMDEEAPPSPPQPAPRPAPVMRAVQPEGVPPARTEMPQARSIREAFRPAAPQQPDEEAFGGPAAPSPTPTVTRTVVTRSPSRAPGGPRPVPYKAANADWAEGQGSGPMSDAVAADLADGGGTRAERKRRSREAAAMDADASPPRRRGIGRFIVYLVILAVLVGGGYAAYKYWPDIKDWVASLGGGDAAETAESTAPEAAASPPAAAGDRVADAGAGNDVRVVGPQPNDAPAPLVNPVGADANAGPTQAILYEEGAAGAATPALEATIAWRLVDDPAGPIISATIVVPERQMTIAFSIQENHNTALAFSHEIDFLVTIPAGYAHPAGGVASIAQLAVKTTEDAIGEPLVGTSNSLPPDFFWIELDPAAETQNVNRLRSRDWFDLGITYANGQRAILTFEKGTDGSQVFQQALAAWAAN